MLGKILAASVLLLILLIITLPMAHAIMMREWEIL